MAASWLTGTPLGRGSDMKRLAEFNFVQNRIALRPIAVVLTLAAICAVAYAAHLGSEVGDLNATVEGLRTRTDARQRALERARTTTSSSGQTGVVSATEEQLRVLHRVERVWSPKLGLLSVAVSGQGEAAQIRVDGLAAHIDEVYALVARLRSAEGPTARITLQRHGVRIVDEHPLASFSLTVEPQ
ncbi:hypothetical protein PCO31010_03148 [Pandoraea commovens]|uniref:Fimbrial protein n=2 Tax=Pandoraea commovens TaxID=2508289 RepID=A0A5E4WAT8_9BURK|nr:hypothetical protein PCO31010_03148 [Pandoraea commovens]